MLKRYEAANGFATLILAHGAGAGQTHPFMVRVATDLCARGITVVTFDFPYVERGRGGPDPAPVLEARFLEVMRDVAPGAFIGGKSMGGRIATQVAARPDFPGACGIVVLGYPLHPPGKPDALRVKHLPAVKAPMLVVQGARDAFGSPDELAPYFGPLDATIHPIAGGDHSFAVPKSKGTAADVFKEIIDTITAWCEDKAQRKAAKTAEKQ